MRLKATESRRRPAKAGVGACQGDRRVGRKEMEVAPPSERRQARVSYPAVDGELGARHMAIAHCFPLDNVL